MKSNWKQKRINNIFNRKQACQYTLIIDPITKQRPPKFRI